AEVDFYLDGPEETSKKLDHAETTSGTEEAASTDAEGGFESWLSARQSDGFPEQAGRDSLRVYTTRPDTLFGATYMVISPEHPLIKQIVAPGHQASVDAYCEKASFKSDRERTDGDRAKTGVFTGTHAINPANQKRIPIYVADYVLAGYGTGAIMAVPAHDQRDFEFATAYDLPVVPVVNPPSDHPQRDAILSGKACFAAEGVAINSDTYDGSDTAAVKQSLTRALAARGVARVAVNYKLRDWLFSRQRFWGEPFPILHEIDDAGEPTGLMRAVPEDQLPVRLPDLDDFKPHGRPEPPLAKADDDWLIVTLDGKRYRRETNTMPQWAGSCWYYLRYIDPKNESALVDAEKEKAWMPVDLYVGGAEHAVLHLLYARFWHKVLFDRGHVSCSEPFGRLVNQGMILGEVEFTGYATDDGTPISATDVGRDADGKWVTKSGQSVQVVSLTDDEVAKQGDGFVRTDDAAVKVESRAFKMSKSRGNVVNPDAVVRDYGADALRLYEMFMGPLEATKPWAMNGVGGVRSFLDRVWRLVIDERQDELTLSPAITDGTCDEDQRRVLHQTIRKVTEDTDAMSFNTAIAKMMEFTNHFTRSESRPREAIEPFLILLAPYAPHLCEELWQALGHRDSISKQDWPTWDASALVESSVEIPVQINGKVKTKIRLSPQASVGEMGRAALGNDSVQTLIAGKQVLKTIAVPGRLINLVVK
ncbi:MAG: leucine--tRNA ligase, partial [Planctomycetota bacterium]